MSTNKIGAFETLSIHMRTQYRPKHFKAFWPGLEDLNPKDMWFEHDHNTCHTANDLWIFCTIVLSVIARGGMIINLLC